MLSEQNIDKLDDAETVMFLRGVNTGATRLRRLIDNFILLVELETGDAYHNYLLRRGTIENIEEVLEAARRRAIPPEGRQPQAVNLQVEGPVQPFVADRELLTIALTQFVENAMKFSPEDKPVMMGAHMEEEAVCVWVQDGGRGIPESELGNIWNIFYQINRPENEDQGTGSGLAIVHSIVEMHGGYTRVVSQVDKGSTFYIFLPVS
jgi:signal transduction histidine kinase